MKKKIKTFYTFGDKLQRRGGGWNSSKSQGIDHNASNQTIKLVVYPTASLQAL